MKNFIILLIFTSLVVSQANAQIPTSFSYQALIRDANHVPVMNKDLSVRVSIIKNNIGGILLYSEKHDVKSDPQGIVSLQIGQGLTLTGNIASLDWSSGPHFVRIETDITGNNNYDIVSESQLLSVPYALLAKNALNIDDADADPTNEMELPTVASPGAIPMFKDGKWTALEPGGEFAILAMIDGYPTWVTPEIEEPATCEDGILNGEEEAVDCGGPDCIPCGEFFDLKLISAGTSKLQIVRLTQQLKGLSLAAAKELVDMAPVIIFTELSLETAINYRDQYVDLGATIELLAHNP